MALSDQEFNRLNTLILERQNPDFSRFSQIQGTSSSPIKDFGIGIAKGLGSTVQGIQDIGLMGMAAIDPTRNFEQIKQTEGIKPLTDANFKADNNAQKAGKTVEFIAELLFPVGKIARSSGAAKTAGATFEGLGSKLSTIGDDVVEGGVKVKDKIADLLVNLDAKTKTALDRTPKEVFDSFVQKGKAAMADDRIRTPLEEVGDSIIKALDDVKTKAGEIGTKKSGFLKIPDAFSGNGIKQFKESTAKFLNSRTMAENDKPVIRSIINEFKKLGDTPSKGQVDKFIDYAQEILYAGEKNLVQPTSNKTVAGLKKVISELNENLKSQLPDEYRNLNKEYSELAQFMKEVNTNLGKEGRSAGAFVKRLFSPSDARTKELFDQLQKITGQDFSRDARLAKFVMETLGDTRATSLLEQIPTSPSGAIGKVIDYTAKKLSDPLKAAGRYIDKTGTKSFKGEAVPQTAKKIRSN